MLLLLQLVHDSWGWRIIRDADGRVERCGESAENDTPGDGASHVIERRPDRVCLSQSHRPL